MMRILRAALISVLLCVGLATPAHGDAIAPTVSGSFTAAVDTSTMRLQNLPRANCLVTADVELTFSGSLIGIAPGTTTAIEAAPCLEVGQNPPGSFFDVFQFRGQFNGTVNGQPASRPLTYSGVTRVGRQINGVIVLLGSAIGPLTVAATAAVGGTYSS